MMIHIRKWGNSLSFRIPKPYALQLGLEENTLVNLSVENGCLVITPQRFLLNDLLSGVNETNLHHEVDTGSPVGGESW